MDLIGDKWPRQSLFHGSAFGVEWNTDLENKIFSKSELDLAVGINQEEALGALISLKLQKTIN